MNDIVRFKNWDCTLKYGTYVKAGGPTALQLLAADTEHNRKMGTWIGEPICTATLNIVPESNALPKSQGFLRDSEENEGLLECLVEAGVVKSLNKSVSTGFIQAHLVEFIRD